jgi:hypothetical protein
MLLAPKLVTQSYLARGDLLSDIGVMPCRPSSGRIARRPGRGPSCASSPLHPAKAATGRRSGALHKAEPNALFSALAGELSTSIRRTVRSKSPAGSVQRSGRTHGIQRRRGKALAASRRVGVPGELTCALATKWHFHDIHSHGDQFLG